MSRSKLIVPDRFNRFKKSDDTYQLYSYSKVSTMWQCSFEFYLARILKRRQEPNLYAFLGTASHETLERFYNNEIKYCQMAEEYEAEISMADLSKLKFVSDEEKNENMSKKYYACMRHFFQNHKVVEFELTNERMLFIVVKYFGEERLFIGYVDTIHTEDGCVIITDYKSSSKYAGKKIKEHGRQLLLYALGVHQMDNIPLDKIKCRWNFLKYINITYQLMNGKFKTTTAERNVWVGKIATPIRRKLKKMDISPEEIEVLMDKALTSNNLDNMPQEIQDGFVLDDAYVYAEVNETEIEAMQKALMEGALDIEQRTDLESEYAWDRCAIDKSDEYYCNSLCGVKKHCKYYSEYLDRSKSMFVKDKDVTCCVDQTSEKDDELEELLGLL